jgi:hypothetical protein
VPYTQSQSRLKTNRISLLSSNISQNQQLRKAPILICLLVTLIQEEVDIAGLPLDTHTRALSSSATVNTIVQIIYVKDMSQC